MLPVLVHGDAAFAGQGVVAETLQLSKVKGYRVGGTIHLIINNQLGFTTPPESARSSEYCTDIGKMVQAPILHVNGDDPEACVRVARLAYDYRQKFHEDVVIDMICYRRLGHNEGDDPSYTQPLMYKKIEARRSVRKLYTEALVKRGDFSIEEAEQALDDFSARLQEALEHTRQSAPAPGVVAAKPPPPIGVLPHVNTGIQRATVDRIYDVMSHPPDGFTVHPKLVKQFDARTKMFEEGEVDWALGESMAFGSLLLEGVDLRVSGQDTRRGTFSQRHTVLVDYDTGAEWAPLAQLDPDQAKFWIYDSLLSEYAALGFEYGYSMVHKDALVAWEAQFGDFVNGAQIVIDQYIVAAEDKWGQTSGLTLLLPHGFEGQGPEHSSGRIERFLALCAEDNIQVAVPTTAAQYFHLLRRQMRREVRKPLVVFTPKSLLRAKPARSKIEELTTGSFNEVLDDPFATDRARSAPGGALLRQGGPRRDRGAQRARRSGRDRAGRAALPVAVRRDRRRDGPVRERGRDRVAPGGAREYGRVELRQGPAVRGAGRRLHDPPGQPLRVGQPGHRQPRHPRPGAGPDPRRGADRAIRVTRWGTTTRLSSSRSGRPSHSASGPRFSRCLGRRPGRGNPIPVRRRWISGRSRPRSST